MVADGLHARTDGLTSLAVLIAVIGAWLGAPILDPIVGLVIGIAIVGITWNATRSIWYRLMNAVDPHLVERTETLLQEHPEVKAIHRLNMRWIRAPPIRGNVPGSGRPARQAGGGCTAPASRPPPGARSAQSGPGDDGVGERCLWLSLVAHAGLLPGQPEWGRGRRQGRVRIGGRAEAGDQRPERNRERGDRPLDDRRRNCYSAATRAHYIAALPAKKAAPGEDAFPVQRGTFLLPLSLLPLLHPNWKYVSTRGSQPTGQYAPLAGSCT